MIMVNALSETLEVTVYRDDQKHSMSFGRGITEKSMESVEHPSETRQTERSGDDMGTSDGARGF